MEMMQDMYCFMGNIDRFVKQVHLLEARNDNALNYWRLS